MKRLLVTGGNGQLGTELKRQPLPSGWEMIAIDVDELNLRNPQAITDFIAADDWHAVINGAAYTAVDKAERDGVCAWEVNALAPAAIADACAARDIPIVQISTDYVFSGDKDGPWAPGDPVAPVNIYGASKLGGELAVRTAARRHAIIRTAWVVSAHGSNFVKTMLRAGAERDSLRVVDDQHGSPTSAADLAGAALTIALRLAEDDSAPSGTWHFSNAGATTWARFAEAIFAASALRGGPSARVEPITTADYPTPARRPANSLLSHDAIGASFGIVPRRWTAALDDILDELVGRVK